MQQQVEITVWVKGERKTFQAAFGKTLREALLEREFSPYVGKNTLLNCRGMGICGTCLVTVLENGEKTQKRSCQIQCFKPIEIELQ